MRLPDADRLEPLECRRSVEERFSSARMVRDYEDAYAAALAGTPAPSEV